ncbi:ribulose-phosphate 3-epimerase [Elysia marginata]|uniref:Ribulose-phosphate 3-epimerase n=1 Tax=Elysia marginata TaxID=1093978 RepID=A0AAV4HRE6_9GAST|nr:ribulose-phosphate 3-epimerase [Elysia marginata]
MSKVEFLRNNYKTLDIGVDGGVGPNTIQQCADAGANLIVSGSALVRSNNKKQTIHDLRSVVDAAIKGRQLQS